MVAGTAGDDQLPAADRGLALGADSVGETAGLRIARTWRRWPRSTGRSRPLYADGMKIILLPVPLSALGQRDRAASRRPARLGLSCRGTVCTARAVPRRSGPERARSRAGRRGSTACRPKASGRAPHGRATSPGSGSATPTEWRLRGRQRAEPPALAAAQPGRDRRLRTKWGIGGTRVWSSPRRRRDDEHGRRALPAHPATAACSPRRARTARSHAAALSRRSRTPTDTPLRPTRSPASLLAALDERGFAADERWVWAYHNYADIERERRHVVDLRQLLSRRLGAAGSSTAGRSCGAPRAACRLDRDGTGRFAPRSARDLTAGERRDYQARVMTEALSRHHYAKGAEPASG